MYEEILKENEALKLECQELRDNYLKLDLMRIKQYNDLSRGYNNLEKYTRELEKKYKLLYDILTGNSNSDIELLTKTDKIHKFKIDNLNIEN